MILALDPGDATIGLATSNNLIIATHYKTIRFNTPTDGINQLFKEVNNLMPNTIIIGNPINMNGSIGLRAMHSQNIKDNIEKQYPQIKVILWDERLSTKAALSIYKTLNLKNTTFKMIKDELSAQVILQSYLDSL